jgi:hypothetical protein
MVATHDMQVQIGPAARPAELMVLLRHKSRRCARLADAWPNTNTIGKWELFSDLTASSAS